ncbi:MAG TPA: indole-3-glycerol phosphate synthase TrpC [Bryobacteraceae bacterium]|nr:indole-3-glycerol phosphate synthase TrpC [Bryobacteraceae bacterium]
MLQTVPGILARIVASKQAALPRLRPQRDALERRAAERTQFRDFRAALTARRPAIIAEIKRASPSKGAFTDQFDPAALARQYSLGGAAALSVLTDQEFFQGALADLETARAASPLPVLRKDFTIDDFQVVEAAAHGADAILLIAAILEKSQMSRLRQLAAAYRMEALVEVHDQVELDSALASGAEIVGVNNRNLHTFEVALETSLQLAEKIPTGIVKVSESGINSPEDVRRLQAAGFDAFLVGERLMKSANPAATLREMQS